MNEVNKTLFIPLYGKASVSKMGIMIKDEMAEKIWQEEGFRIRGKMKSKWLAYNMAMRARIFDDWTEKMLKASHEAVVLHLGCGMDSRFMRVREQAKIWVDCDFPEVINVRRKYFHENERYRMLPFDLRQPEMVEKLPAGEKVILILEGVSMYLTNQELHDFFAAIEKKYRDVHVLMDVYTMFAARASKHKNPINQVGVTTVYGMDSVDDVIKGTRLKLAAEHSLTPPNLVEELRPSERLFFSIMFNESLYRKIYRLYELC